MHLVGLSHLCVRQCQGSGNLNKEWSAQWQKSGGSLTHHPPCLILICQNQSQKTKTMVWKCAITKVWNHQYQDSDVYLFVCFSIPTSKYICFPSFAFSVLTFYIFWQKLQFRSKGAEFSMQQTAVTPYTAWGSNIRGVTGGTDQTSGGCSLC